MRLREIHKIMDENYPNLKKGLYKQKQNDSFYYIDNFSEITRAISDIAKTGLIDTEISQLENSNFLPFTEQQKIKLTQERYKLFTNILSNIITKISTIDELVEHSYESQHERPDSLIVSFPNRDLSLEELSEITDSLYKTFKILGSFEPFNNDSIKVTDFDIGSNWLVIALSVSTAVKVFGDIVQAIRSAKTTGLTIAFLEKQLEVIGMEEEEKQKFNSQIREIDLSTYRDLSNKIIENNDLENSDELISQMAKVLEQVNHLNEEGVGFSAGINSAIEVSKSFPSMEQQKALDIHQQLQSLKQITTEENDNE